MTSAPAQRSHHSFSGKIGLARADITPPVGIYARNWGAARHDLAESVHRPLMLSVLTLKASDDDKPLVLFDADLGWWRPLDVFRRFQSTLLNALELPSSHLLFALTHTHAAAPLMDPDPALTGSDLIGPWLETIRDTAIRTAQEAIQNTFDGQVEWHSGRCGLASVRDLPDPDGAERYLCGFNPDGEPDDTLLVARVTDSNSRVRATVVNYACHPTTLAWDNKAISPDYIGAMREVMESNTGGLAFFLQGASGDLAPRHQYVGDTDVADAHGRQLGFAALSVLEDMSAPGQALAFERTVESGAPLAVWAPQQRPAAGIARAVERTVTLPLKDWPTAAELERQRLACTDRALQERLRRKQHIRQALGDSDTFDLPLYAWRIGDATIVGCCCEPYSVLQQEIRRRWGGQAVAVINLVNGSIGYLPPVELYDQDVYPVWQTPFAAGSLERTIDALDAAIASLWSEPTR